MLRAIAGLFSLVSASFILYLFTLLALAAWPALSRGDIFQFGYWDYRSNDFSALSMFYGSSVVAALALLLASIMGIAAALCTSELLSGKGRLFAKLAIELLAGIPSVVYGLLGVVYLLPWINHLVILMGGVSGDSLLAAGCLLGIMILPTVTTFADDAFRTVPKILRDEAYGLGLSRLQLILFVVLPQAKSGLIRALMLALGRALGETIAIYLMIGRADQMFNWESLTFNSLINSGQAITTKLGGSELAIAYGDSLHWQSLMSLALCLWLFVGLLAYSSEFLTEGRN